MNTHVNARTRTAIAVLAALGFACLGELPEPPQTGEKQKSTHHSTDANGAILLRDGAGNAIARGATTPYSPEQTCGGCHDVATITSGYHFQQGADVVSDTFNPKKPWLLSPGMYGKT